VPAGIDQLGDVGRYIREQRRQAELSLRKLASQAGVSNPYLSQIERGLRQPSARILKDIAKALRISAETLYVRAGILDEEEPTDLEVGIARDPHLTERQKQVLIDIYRSFRNDGEEQP
jgi:transcriptional regulator with XRE-family HTH domain